MTNQHAALQFAFSRQSMFTMRFWRREADEVLSRIGLSDATAWPLLNLARTGDGVRHGTLAAALGIEGPSLVRLLDQLGRAGLVTRRDDPADRRARTIHLTERGRALADEAEAALAALRARLLDGITEADLRASLRVMRSIQATIGLPSLPLPASALLESEA